MYKLAQVSQVQHCIMYRVGPSTALYMYRTHQEVDPLVRWRGVETPRLARSDWLVTPGPAGGLQTKPDMDCTVPSTALWPAVTNEQWPPTEQTAARQQSQILGDGVPHSGGRTGFLTPVRK